MTWSLGGWKQKVESLVNQCADKVVLELEEVIMTRLREAGENVIQSFFEAQSCPNVFIAEHQDALEAEKEDTAPQVLISPRPLIDEEVLYAFGIIQANQVDSDLLGMEDRPCHIVENGNLGMLVCPVPRKDYNEESLHHYMEDMAWVETHARCHEETLLKTMESRSVVPLPFCTIFIDEGSIKRQLAQNVEAIQDDLQRLGNYNEMHVKLFVNRKQFSEKLHEDSPYTGGQSGGGYFQKRQWEKKIEEELERVINDYGESLYQDLGTISAEIILLDKAGVVAPEGQHVVFAVQCLMVKEDRGKWDKLLEEFDKAADPLGFILDVSGPWPPYHFSRLINEEETMGG
ncbi:MAG TPA: GvpL/GvpF family gas vesicle protein [Desulfosporosinus sp.]|nr:GvpL/GvpF family gas vesicle protein [Desulfosporosinus sp.]